jgi:hypothetical protein
VQQFYPTRWVAQQTIQRNKKTTKGNKLSLFTEVVEHFFIDFNFVFGC